MPKVTSIVLQETQVHINNKANHCHLVGQVYKVCKDGKGSEIGTAVLPTGFHGGFHCISLLPRVFNQEAVSTIFHTAKMQRTTFSLVNPLHSLETAQSYCFYL
ncbi:UNVERIFIED_CONTAM: hypothetical protein K2H54_075167 [Gekko kuhli]